MKPHWDLFKYWYLNIIDTLSLEFDEAPLRLILVREQARQNWGAGGAMAPSLFCQAKLNVALDFKISTEAWNFEIINSIY